MLQDTPLSFWTSNQVISYTELQDIRRLRYSECAPRILKEVRENLKSFRDASSQQEYFKILSHLASLALDLSCYNSAWIDFDNAVFELMVLPPSKVSSKRTYKYLYWLVKTTLDRFQSS